jgi:hypothetical protein
MRARRTRCPECQQKHRVPGPIIGTFLWRFCDRCAARRNPELRARLQAERRRLIRRSRATGPAAARPLPVESPPVRTTAEETKGPAVLAVECPRCHARAGAKCRNYAGRGCAPHGDRVRAARLDTAPSFMADQPARTQPTLFGDDDR